MSGLNRIYLENGIGEQRAIALDDQDNAIGLFRSIDPALFDYARFGRVYEAVVRSKDAGTNGYFVEIEGLGAAFLPSGQKLDEGQRIMVRVRSEGHAEKKPVLALEKSGEEQAAKSDFDIWRATLPGSHSEDVISDDPEGAALLRDAFDDASSDTVSLTGGGRLNIETTRALTAIDIDSAGRQTKSSGLSLAEVAIAEAARHIALRHIGGLVVIDVPGRLRGKQGDQLRDAFKQQFRKHVSRKVEVLRPSPFGLMEISLARTYRPIGETAEPNLQSAIDLFRSIEREGVFNRSSRLKVNVSNSLSQFLARTIFDWKNALGNRIGPRFEIEVMSNLRDGKFEIRLDP